MLRGKRDSSFTKIHLNRTKSAQLQVNNIKESKYENAAAFKQQHTDKGVTSTDDEGHMSSSFFKIQFLSQSLLLSQLDLLT